MKRTFLLIGLIITLILIGCAQEYSPLSSIDQSESPMSLAKATGGQVLNQINRKLAAQGVNYRIQKAQYSTDAASGYKGKTIYVNDRSLRMPTHWAAFDPNRGGGRNITYMIDMGEGGTTSGLTPAQTGAAIDRAMTTWNSVRSTHIPLAKASYPGGDLGYVEFLLGFGGLPGWYTDITHAGWESGAFFDAFVPGGSTFILGVTFTFIWIDANGNPVDMNNDKKADVAFREINYNDAFSWAIDANFDVESIALHEVGHGLSQGHFGKIFRTMANGALHFAPLAVMNAAYTGVQQKLTGTDKGGHSSIWGNWPNK